MVNKEEIACPKLEDDQLEFAYVEKFDNTELCCEEDAFTGDMVEPGKSVDKLSDLAQESSNHIMELKGSDPGDYNYSFDTDQYFGALDKNGDGFIDQGELALALERSSVPTNPAVVEKIFSELDKNGDGVISLEEFKAFSREKDKKLRSMFDSFDHTRTGSINATDVRVALEKLGLESDELSVNSLISQMDVDGDGVVTFEEFTRFYHLIPMETVKSMFMFWERDAAIDIGQSATIAENRPGVSPWNKLVAGSVAGGLSRSATAPLELVKVIMQAQAQGKTITMAEGLRNVYTDGGYRAFFRGNGTNVLRIAPETSCKFIVYDKMKELISKNVKRPSVVESLTCGGIAGVVSQTVVYPLQITKTRINIAPTGTYKGIADAMRHIVRNEGGTALYKGCGASIMGIIPYASVDLAIYNRLKEEYSQRYYTDPTVMTLLAAGSISSISAMIVSYPLERIRTLLQIQGSAGREAEFSGTLDCAMKTFRSSGLTGLYRGILPNMLKSVPAIAVSYATYEKMKLALAEFTMQATTRQMPTPAVM